MSRFPPLTLVLAAAALTGVLSVIAVLAPSPVVADGSGPLRAPPALPEGDARPYKDYTLIGDKPLFAPQRRPDPAGEGGMPPLEDYRVVGTMLVGSAKTVLIERVASHVVMTLHPGDEFDGRRVVDIGPDTIALKGANGPEFLIAR